MEENMQINQHTVDKLIGHELLTSWENGFIESVSDQLKRGRSLSSNQERVVNRCIEKTTPEKIAEREEWVKEYRAKHRETALLCARYYKEQGYFHNMVQLLMDNEDFVPSRENYTKMCENKYAERVLNEHYREPKYEVGKIVYVCSAAPHSHKSRFARGGIILQANAGPITAACKGAKKYLVLPIGEAHGHVLEERWLKSRKPRGLDTKLDDEVPF